MERNPVNGINPTNVQASGLGSSPMVSPQTVQEDYMTAREIQQLRRGFQLVGLHSQRKTQMTKAENKQLSGILEEQGKTYANQQQVFYEASLSRLGDMQSDMNSELSEINRELMNNQLPQERRIELETLKLQREEERKTIGKEIEVLNEQIKDPASRLSGQAAVNGYYETRKWIDGTEFRAYLTTRLAQDVNATPETILKIKQDYLAGKMREYQKYGQGGSNFQDLSKAVDLVTRDEIGSRQELARQNAVDLARGNNLRIVSQTLTSALNNNYDLGTSGFKVDVVEAMKYSEKFSDKREVMDTIIKNVANRPDLTLEQKQETLKKINENLKDGEGDPINMGNYINNPERVLTQYHVANSTLEAKTKQTELTANKVTDAVSVVMNQYNGNLGAAIQAGAIPPDIAISTEFNRLMGNLRSIESATRSQVSFESRQEREDREQALTTTISSAIANNPTLSQTQIANIRRAKTPQEVDAIISAHNRNISRLGIQTRTPQPNTQPSGGGRESNMVQLQRLPKGSGTDPSRHLSKIDLNKL